MENLIGFQSLEIRIVILFELSQINEEIDREYKDPKHL